jgi:hypothetical protein
MYKKFKNWCNANQGWLTFIAIIIAIFGLIPYNSIDFKFANSFKENLIELLFYNIKIPVYFLVLILVIGLIFINRIRRKYINKKISIEFLEGQWKCEWIENGETFSEICTIKDGKYLVKREHWFDIKDFKYDNKNNRISFIKASVRSKDKFRNLKNVLTINDNDLMTGADIGDNHNFSIKYKRLQ